MSDQTTFSREEIDQHLCNGTWHTLRADDRVCWQPEWGGGLRNMSVRSYVRQFGPTKVCQSFAKQINETR